MHTDSVPVSAVVVVFFLLCLPLGAATYYVDKDSIGGASADSNPGTITKPWSTIARANAVLRAGDTVYIRKGVYTTDYIRPANSGSSGSARITYAAFNGEQVILRGTAHGIRLNDKSYITVTGIRFLNCSRNIHLTGSSQNTIESCEFDNPAGPSNAWAGSLLSEGSRSNRILRCTFSRYGAESGEAGNYQDRGAILDIGSLVNDDRSVHNLIAGNSFSYGGHHILGVYADANIVRGNTFHNEEWFPCHRSDSGELCGNRNVIISTSRLGGAVRNIIEDNYIVFSGLPPDASGSNGLGVRTRYNIIRRNIFYHCDSAGLSLSSTVGTNGSSSNYIYNNVFYRNGYASAKKAGLLLNRWFDDSNYARILGVAIKNNIFYRNQLQAISYINAKREEQIVERNWEEAGDPAFVDVSGQAVPSDFGVFDFHLRAQSPCIDNGAFLTHTTSSGSSSTVLRVDDAGYFTDGLGMMAGDRIQLAGQSRTVRIIRIDYGSDTITIDFPLSWAASTGVGLSYSGARPDQGAYEYAGSAVPPTGTPPAAPANLRVQE